MTRTVIAMRGAEVALAAAAVVATVPAYRDFFGSGGYLVPLTAAACAGALGALRAATLRWGTSATIVTGIAGFLTVTGAVILRGRELTSIGTGIANGWMRMLTTGLPADPTAELLILPALLVYAAGFGAVTVALRTRAVLAPVPFPLLSLLAALLLTAGHTEGAFPVAVAVLAPLAVLVLIRAVRRGGVTGRAYLADRARFGLPMVALVAVAGIAAAHAVPIGEKGRFDPRALIRAELTIEDTVTPLASVRSQLEETPPRELFTVRVTGAVLDRVRTAALDDYDGTLWTSADRFLTAGRTLPADSGPAPSTEVRLAVGITGLAGPHLPAAGWPRQVTAGRVGFCARSGVLAAEKADRPGLSYDLVAGVRPRDDAMRSAGPDLAAGARYRALPAALPDALITAADQLTEDAPTSFAKLEALERGLRAMPYTATARPGHTLERLGSLFADGPDRTTGYAEQYAATFAVLARSLDFPARVVTGYRLRPESLTAGVHTVRTRDAWAWAEVKIAGYGWVAFDPADPHNRRQPPPVDHTSSPAGSGTAPSAPEDPGVQARPRQPLADELAAVERLPLVLVILAILTAGLQAVVLAEKWRRRRDRRRGTPAQRIAGAWMQSTGRLRAAGLPIHRSWTAYETAEAARARFGEAASPVATLARLFAEACYGTRPPGPEPADEAWRADRALRAALRRERGLARTAGAWLSPASLWHRSG
ncbi:transglutaminase-like putative cysteine protease [Catenuloplanes nepalensis]|uniref:Transglutaminase-like putative cysteine protease n=1 Tax=Catenuloplanes nepalensis TaxID=587533 RepID=A0ABT9MT96_9ACTN|nr:transglutaminaseTgpA domain-containing protein [Catenuloplanes nepalensis]MDP9794241.1 transglutaminase-like putative cysteine protease [Catenuloplanes nepalensis]